ncbi:MAG: YheC/YheD family protein [Syntrophomonas sp.]
MRQDPTERSFLLMQCPKCNELKNDHYLVWVGNRAIQTQIKCELNDGGKRAILNNIWGKKLGVPPGRYRVFQYYENNIRLGPLVGILTNRDKHAIYPAGKNAKIFKEMFSAARNQGVFLFEFYPEGVNIKNKTIKGHSIDRLGKFYSSTFPFPDVVYNRIRYRVIENGKDVKRVLKIFETVPGVNVFNTRFLNKLEVYRVLKKNPSTAGIIPETALYNTNSLKYFLGKYGTIYLKPIANSRGKGIIKLGRGASGTYYVQHAAKAYSDYHPNLTQAHLKMKQYGLKPMRYLVQKAIPLATYRGRPFDLRVQVQKDAHGKWMLTGVGARVAGPNRIVTHVPNGGTAKAFDSVINEAFKESFSINNDINKQLLYITGVVPEALEKGLKLELAILSMDIGIDNNGKLWLIEVNSKPASFDEDAIRKVHTQTLVDYFIFCASNTKRTKGMNGLWN